MTMPEYEECRKCIYKPCDKRKDDVKYCFVRFLIKEAEIEAENTERKRPKKHGTGE